MSSTWFTEKDKTRWARLIITFTSSILPAAIIFLFTGDETITGICIGLILMAFLLITADILSTLETGDGGDGV